MNTTASKSFGVIGFFINNSVAANLLMLFVLVLGGLAYVDTNKQIYPPSSSNFIEINFNYYGASAPEVEQAVVVKIEDSLRQLPQIKRMRSWSRNNGGRLILDLRKGANATEVIDKIKGRLDGISSLPRGMDPILVELLQDYQAVVRLALVGEGDLVAMKPFVQTVQKELLDLANVSLVDVNVPSSELSIEVDPSALRRYQLSLQDIQTRLAEFSTDISAGQLRSETGVIALRVENQAYDVNAYQNIPLIVADNGLVIKLKDVATVKDQFAEGVHFFTYDDKNAMFIEVQATDDQDMTLVAESVRNYVAYKNQHLPHWLQLETIIDGTDYLEQRLGMMEKNLLQGAVLVLLMLSLFLSFRLAFWVVVGLPFCFLGASLLMPFFGVTINIVSLFAFIMVLGLVVDDAIVVGESIDQQTKTDGPGNAAVEAGVRKVSKPAIFGVLTTIAVFVPFIFSTGEQSDLFKGIATIVIFCLLFSIIESKLILPAHLRKAGVKSDNPSGFKARFNQRLSQFSQDQLARAVSWSIERRFSVILACVAALVVSIGLIQTGHVNSIADPKVPIDHPELIVELDDNASPTTVNRAVAQLDEMVKQVEQQTIKAFGHGMLESILIESVDSAEIKVTVPLVPESERPYNTFELAKRWRQNMPDIVGLKAVHIKEDVLGQYQRYGDFGYFLFSDDIETLNNATKHFIARLKQQPGVYEVSSTISAGQKELLMALKPVANVLGLTLSDIGRQLAHSHFGAEVERFNRDGEQIRVLVRYDQSYRTSISQLQYARINTPAGDEVMLGDLVTLTEQESVTTIRREQAKRSLYVFASVDEQQVNIGEVVDRVHQTLLPELKQEFGQVSTQLGGKVKETMAEKDQMLRFTIAALLMVYILLAVPLKSYAQPFLIMSIIPFSAIGAIIGHWIFGEDFSLVSNFGLVAAAGVVVNDSLILVDRINHKIAAGLELIQGVVEAVGERFRAILLTSITTFVGLLPIMFETSLQAKFVTPMAISLGFAVLFATFITLFLIPCLYVTGSRFKQRFGSMRLGFRRAVPVRFKSI